jgi:hypothetical protein
MLFILMCAAMIVAAAWPKTAVGRMLHRLMVKWPARQLARLEPDKVLPKLTAGRILLVLLVLSGIALAIAVAREDVTILFAQMAPEGIAWFAAFDIAAYLDVVALAILLSATVRLRGMYVALKVWVARSALIRLMRRGRGARTRAPRPDRRTPPPSNDDEPARWDLGLAA